jgi:sensor histidine kinase YesM
MEHIRPKYNDLVPLSWWMVEILFWVGFSLTSFIALTLFYNEQPRIVHGVNLAYEAILGMVFTRPILWSAARLDKLPRPTNSAVLLGIVLLTSQSWNVVRMFSFSAFFPQQTVWDQLGGWAFSAILIFALWTALFYSVRAHKIAAAQKDLASHERFRRLNAEAQNSNAQLKMLRYQINPHFIFNTLNSVNALIATNRSKDARDMVDALGELLRMTLERDPPLIIPLSEEINTTCSYLEVEKLRFRDRLTTTVNIDDGLEEISVPSLILQPLVENAVRHGVEAQSEPCHILIEAKQKADHIKISIADTGPGLQTKNPTHERSGLGLENVKSRLKSVYGEDASFSIKDREGGGVKVTLCLPLQVPSIFR